MVEFFGSHDILFRGDAASGGRVQEDSGRIVRGDAASGGRVEPLD